MKIVQVVRRILPNGGASGIVFRRGAYGDDGHAFNRRAVLKAPVSTAQWVNTF